MIDRARILHSVYLYFDEVESKLLLLLSDFSIEFFLRIKIFFSLSFGLVFFLSLSLSLIQLFVERSSTRPRKDYSLIQFHRRVSS